MIEKEMFIKNGAVISADDVYLDQRDATIEAQAAEIERLKKAIKIQASAVRTLQANEDTEINILRKQKREWHQAVLSLDSEREANAILTTEIEQWKVDYDCAMMDVERLRELLNAWTELAREYLDTELAGRTFAALRDANHG